VTPICLIGFSRSVSRLRQPHGDYDYDKRRWSDDAVQVKCRVHGRTVHVNGKQVAWQPTPTVRHALLFVGFICDDRGRLRWVNERDRLSENSLG
jgi:hypothetical protein